MERVLSVLETERDAIRQEKSALMAKRKILTDEQARLAGEIQGITDRHASESYTVVADLHAREIGEKAVNRLQDQHDKVAHATSILDNEEIRPVQTRLDAAEQKHGSVETLLNRRREEFKRAMEKEEERRLDDVGVLRWFRQQDEGEDSNT